MNEFGSRIAAQRQVLRLVNRKKWDKEELFGLSSKAIDRWVSLNRIDPESVLVSLVKAASAKLFFLSNRSQEQISDEYVSITSEFAVIASRIEIETR